VCSKAGGGDKLMDVSVSVSDMEEAIQSNDDQCVRNLTNLSLPVGLWDTQGSDGAFVETNEQIIIR
jgi:hypothetical protein